MAQPVLESRCDHCFGKSKGTQLFFVSPSLVHLANSPAWHEEHWHTHYRTVGTGNLHQGRVKAFPIQGDEPLYTVQRYGERNALRAGLVQREEDWPYSSLDHRLHGLEPISRLSPWPLPSPPDWLSWVNPPETEVEPEALRRSAKRGRPFGSEEWGAKTVKKLGESTVTPRGRARKHEGD